MIEIDHHSCPIHTFMLFLDALAQDEYICEASLTLVENFVSLYSFLQFESFL